MHSAHLTEFEQNVKTVKYLIRKLFQIATICSVSHYVSESDRATGLNIGSIIICLVK